VCAWDRAGAGFSSPSPEPQDILHTTRDLEKALKSAQISGPYVLVGHSLGGYESLLFADRHPHSVVGMVLVDPSIPDQQRILAQGGTEVSGLERDHRALQVAAMSRCAARARSGALKLGSPDPDGCLAFPGDYPQSLKDALLPSRMAPESYETTASLIENFDADSTQVMNAARNYGKMPLIVLTAGITVTIPSQLHPSDAAQAAFTHYQAVDWPHAHDQLAKLSSRGRNQVVDGSNHPIHLVNPLAVVGAVEDVVAQIERR